MAAQEIYIYSFSYSKTSSSDSILSSDIVKKEMLFNNVRNLRQVKNIYLIDSLKVPYVYCPSVFGIAKTFILLPASQWNSLNDEQKAAALAHEIAHVKYHDNLLNLLLLFITAVFWWNPIVRIGLRAFRLDIELLRDSRIISKLASKDRETYASSLLHLAKMCSHKYEVTPHSGIMCSSGIGLRIILIRNYSKRSILLSIFITVVIFLLLFILEQEIGILSILSYTSSIT